MREGWFARCCVAAVAACTFGVTVALVPGLAASGASAVPGSAVPGSAPCAPSPSPDALPAAGSGQSPYGVSAASPSDVWAAGSLYDGRTDRPLALHRDATGWTLLRPPTPAGASAAYLNAVAIVSPTDVWAVGHSISGTGELPLAEHWNGTAWAVLPTPYPPGSYAVDLRGVAAVSASDVWAVGFSEGSLAVYRTFVLHWDGSTWTEVPSPNATEGNDALWGIDASSASDAWAVGYATTVGGGPGTLALAEHWDGTGWQVVPTPQPSAVANSLTGVLARSTGDAWAVGTYNGGSDNLSLILRWDGSAWAQVPGANVPASGNVLNAVASVAGDDVWAAGYWYRTAPRGPQESLLEHWDGSAWSIVGTPDLTASGSSPEYLNGVAADPSGRVWTLGSTAGAGIALAVCEVVVGDGGFAPATFTVAIGSSVAWSIPASDGSAHRLVDATGLALFDSGLRDPGGSFTFVFGSAGAYRVTDPTNGALSTARIPASAAPPTGTVSTTFTVRWSNGPAAPGLVFDVQIQRPGGARFVDWRTAMTTASATFVPDDGPGAYAFRARARAATGGSHAGWSPPASIEVTGDAVNDPR